VFVFRVYKDAELAVALERVFGKKCAYCESIFAHVTPKDVEHFRPKSEIDTGEGDLVPGYYWLAGEWDNLLVSCPDCNRGRKFEVEGQPAPVRLGKSTQFPLAKEAGRIRASDSGLDGEEVVRLLIDPCKEEPADHLTFDDEGLIHARPDAAGQPSMKGEVSIRVYALQRKDLVLERLRVLDRLVFQIEQLRRALENQNDFRAAGNTAAADRNLEQVRDLTQDI
jgi:uncharacterized protein (TIGR02646 family)